jgi:RNA polymerase sigma-70 factor, ECF subfamily
LHIAATPTSGIRLKLSFEIEMSPSLERSRSFERSNAAWLVELLDPGPIGRRAQRDLRELILRALTRGLSSRPEAAASLEDFAQESVVRISGQLSSFRDESRFTTWAIAVAMRVSFSALRRRHWRDVSIESLVAGPDGAPHAGEPPDPSTLSPERAAARSEILTHLERCVLETLTERQRQVVIAELRAMPQEEITAQLGKSRNAIYKLGHDARRAMQRALEEAGYSKDTIRWAFE